MVLQGHIPVPPPREHIPNRSLSVRYGAVWEDADVLCDALAPVAQGKRLLSIASAGDNVLALLTLNPAEVVAVDSNPAQLACLELRITAFERLSDDALLAFLGAEPSNDRLRTYTDLRSSLGQFTRNFWDQRRNDIQHGIINRGRLECYLCWFRRYILPLIHSRPTRISLLEPKNDNDRQLFYQEDWNTWRWRFFFRAFFNRAVMSAFGREASHFRHVRGPFVADLLERARHGLVKVPTHDNPYLALLVNGAYGPGSKPRYLRAEYIPQIRARISRIRPLHGRVEQALGDESFDGFNLSNIFEYMSPEQHERSYLYLLHHANRGARLAYWNLFVRRSCPTAAQPFVSSLSQIAEVLHAKDRVCTYASFHLEEAI